MNHRTSLMGRNLKVITKHSSASCPILAVSKSRGHCGSLISDNSGVTDLTRQPSALMEAASAQREFMFVALTAWSCPAIEFTRGTFWQRTHTKIQKAVIFNLTDTEGLCVCEGLCSPGQLPNRWTYSWKRCLEIFWFPSSHVPLLLRHGWHRREETASLLLWRSARTEK